MPRRRRFLVEWAAVSVVASGLFVALTLTDATSRIDNILYDAAMRAAAPAPSDDIVVVAIDEASLEAFGRWPWPRERHADFFRQMAKARPRAIAYDVAFAEPTPADDALAQAIRGAGSVFLPALVQIPGPNGAGSLISDPVAPIGAAATGVGHVNISFDADGVVRRIFLAQTDGRRAVRQLVEQLRHPRAPQPQPWDAGDGLGRASETLVRFHGRSGAYRSIPFAAAARGEAPPEIFAGKTVLVGATASGLNDRYPTPMQDLGGMAGVEIQANLLQSLRDASMLKPLGPAGRLFIGGAALAVLFFGCLRLSPRWLLSLTLSVAAALLVGALASFWLLRVWAPPTAALAALVLAYPLWSWRRLEAASHYMDRELARFRGDDGIAPAGAPGAGDAVLQQLAAMDHAVARLRGLRRFVDEVVQSLPDATVVCDARGQVLLLNAEARLLWPEARPGAAWPSLVAGWRFVEIEGEPEAEAWAPDARVYRVREAAYDDAGAEHVIVRLRDVTQVRADAEQRERMLALLTHDMRSPQVSILALVRNDESAEGRQIAALAGRTLSLAENFVLLARAQADTYALQTVNLAGLLVEAADALWPQAAQRGIEIGLNGVDEDRLVMGDRSLLVRALVNLIDNAVKYSDAGSQVLCEIGGDASTVTCTITDQGRGMSPDEAARLEQPFQRGGDRTGGGAGLGVALVRAVVARHCGRMAFRTAPGEGVRVSLSLPRVAD